MKHSASALKELAVECLCYSIVLWSVMGGESAFSALLSEIISELIAHEFTATVHSEAFDLHAVLSAHPSGKGFVGIKSLVFGAQKSDVGPACVIISESNIVVMATDAESG